jgi:SAM-dependent methyltransferase
MPLSRLQDFISRSRAIGWRSALSEVAGERPFFAHRLRNLPLGNWHLLRALPRESSALDLGCGFGSLALGFADHYRFVVGLDALWSRVSYGRLRALEDNGVGIGFVQGNGLALPFRDGRFNLVAMNGVLEWAWLYAREAAPRSLQVAMLRETRRVLTPNGTVAVAIENRFAMETLMGMTDTHTRLRFVPALPRGAANLLSRALRHKPYRTLLYSAAGYRHLLHDAGYPRVRIFDLVSSYNDYDFVVDPGDAATYRLLWDLGLVRTFSTRAGNVRRSISRRWPKTLGAFAYAYLVLGGDDVGTVLDAGHRFWKRAASYGASAGASRFACQSPSVGALTIVAHDAKRVVSALELSTGATSLAGSRSTLSERLREKLALNAEPVAQWEDGGVTVRCVNVPR